MHGGDFFSQQRKGSSGAPRSLLRACGRVLGVLSLTLGCPQGPQPQWDGDACLESPVQPQHCWWESPPIPTSGQVPGGHGTRRALRCACHGCRCCGAFTAAPSVARRQDKAEQPIHGWLGVGKAGCSQHHLEKRSCWVLLLFIALC